MHIRTVLPQVIAVGALAAALFLLVREPASFTRASEPVAHVSSAGVTTGASSSEPTITEDSGAEATPSPAMPEGMRDDETVSPTEEAATEPAPQPAPEAEGIVRRIENPYPTPPKSLAAVNPTARNALVNILCVPKNGSTLRPISGSGTIIDSRGIVLTNAHVAQYVLLSQSNIANLSCTIRSGAPARALWVPNVLYLPKAWVEEHAKDIRSSHVLGTGAHDYALLYIARTIDGSERPAAFPAIAVDTREGIGFVGDLVLAAGYPAEFLDGMSTFGNLYASASPTAINKLMTLGTNTIDVISLGGVIQAQSGSSGGAVVNAWERLIGVLTTTSEGATTAERDLRAITLSYISRDLKAQSGSTLEELLAEDPVQLVLDFTRNEAPALIRLFAEAL